MTAADDATILARLQALDPPLRVHDSDVPDSNPDTKVIAAALPYVVFYALMDDPAPGDSLAGTSGAYLTGFQLTGVGETREQAKRALEPAQAPLDPKQVVFPGDRSRFVKRTDVNQFVRRDDTWTRPGGAPLFFGVDRYAVVI
jgi:hypothetical protein